MKKEKKLVELAKIVRSKNAGPFLFTFDIIFDDSDKYQKVKKSKVINRGLISKLYKLSKDTEVSIVEFDSSSAIKITFPRLIPSGNVGDTDVYGAQQHVPLYSIKVPWS